MARHDLILPELGLDRVTASLWLVDLDQPVSAGDRILEVLGDGVTIDLPAPCSGVLIEQLVDEDDEIMTGQRLGVIEERE